MKKEDKRAQFYIIGAVIIILIVLSMVGLKNYVIVEQEPTGFYDLGKDLELEGSAIIDYGIHQNEEIQSALDDFTKQYSDYISETGEDFELQMVYGNEIQAYLVSAKMESTGDITTDLGTTQSGSGEVETSITALPLGQTYVPLEIFGTTYNFNLKENENFFFVIAKSKGFEKYVIEKGS